MTRSTETIARLQVLTSMLIFGSIGIFVRYIPLPSSILAMFRAVMGSLFLICVIALGRKKPSREGIKRNFPLLCVSGIFIGANWILLFEAYRYTTVSTATLCYYMAPVFITLASPLVVREKLTPVKLMCIAAALVGMALISGVGAESEGSFVGILLGLGAAVLYASVVLMNKKIVDLGSYDTTIVQLAAAAVVLLPYTLLTEDFSAISLDVLSIVLLIIVGIVHTGIAYALYFASIKGLKAQTAAICSYIDPVTAIILSALILHEKMGVMSIIGAVLVLSSTLVSELWGTKK